MAAPEPDLDALRAAVQLACKPSNVGRINTGRAQVLALPRSWVLQHLEQIAAETLDLADFWEYHRLLELAEMLDVDLVRRLARSGLGSSDLDIREAAEHYAARYGPPP